MRRILRQLYIPKCPSEPASVVALEGAHCGREHAARLLPRARGCGAPTPPGRRHACHHAGPRRARLLASGRRCVRPALRGATGRSTRDGGDRYRPPRRALLVDASQRKWEVLVVDDDGRLDAQSLMLHELRALHGFTARDVMAVDAESPRVNPSVLPRRGCIVLTVSHVRALVTAERVVFFGVHRPGARAFAEDVATFVAERRRHARLEAPAQAIAADPAAAPPHGDPPFEFMLLELTLAAVCDRYEKRIRFCSPVVRSLLSSVRSNATIPDETQLHRLFPLTASVTSFSASATSFLKSIRQLMNDDDELVKMCLTARERRLGSLEQSALDAELEAGKAFDAPTDHDASEAATALSPAKWEPPSEHIDELEELLQLYHRRMSGIRADCEALLHSVDSAQQILRLNLATYRNHLIRVNLQLSMVMAGLGIGTFGAGIFGMNLVSGVEEAPYWFVGVAVTSALSGAAFAKWFAIYAKRTAPSGESLSAMSNMAGRIDDIANTISSLHVLDSLDRENFSRMHPEMSHEEVELIFESFDSDNDGLLEFEEYLASMEDNDTSEPAT